MEELLPPIDVTEPPVQLAAALHLLLCKRKHVDEECRWYFEEQLAERWEQPDHVTWLDKAEGILLMTKRTEEDIVQMLNQLIPIIGQLSFIRKKFASANDIIDVILEETKE